MGADLVRHLEGIQRRTGGKDAAIVGGELRERRCLLELVRPAGTDEAGKCWSGKAATEQEEADRKMKERNISVPDFSVSFCPARTPETGAGGAPFGLGHYSRRAKGRTRPVKKQGGQVVKKIHLAVASPGPPPGPFQASSRALPGPHWID